MSLLCISLSASAQKHDYQWILGFDRSTSPVSNDYGTVKLDFNSMNLPVLTRLPKSDVYFSLSNSSVSDSDGKLQCATNGTRIFGPDFSLMQNGDTLITWPYYTKFGESSPQTALLLPIPENTGRYILFAKQPEFYQGNGFGSSKIYTNFIDMYMNNRRGRVTEKRKVIMQDTLEDGLLTACRHANGRDWWIIQPEFKSNRLHRLLLTNQGVLYHGMQVLDKKVSYGLGQTIFTPDGTKMIRSNRDNLQDPGIIDIYDFDRCTGLLSNQRTIVWDYEGYKFGIGVACSPDSRYLYVTQALYINQYDLTAPDIEATEVQVGEYDGALSVFGQWEHFGQAQLAPDGRIYIGTGYISTYHMSTIAHPTRQGIACGFRQRNLYLLVTHQGSVPNHPHFRLGPLDSSPCDTLGLDNHPSPTSAGSTRTARIFIRSPSPT